MKLLHIISSMDPRSGGPCQGIRNLASVFLKNGVSVEVVCLDDPKSSYLSNETIRVHALGSGRGSWKFHESLGPWLKENLSHYDGVILNGMWQYPGFVLSRLAQSQNHPPYFVFPHGMLDPWFQRAPERRFKAARNWLYWRVVEHAVISRAEALFFTCEEEMRLARGTFRPYRPKRQITVGYGIFHPPPWGQNMAEAFSQRCPGLNGRPYFLFLGRIHSKKGIDLLVHAFAKLCQARPDRLASPVCLVIAGPGAETEYGQSMWRLAKQLCPVGSVFWPGMLTGDAKWGALYGAEAFVLTSHQENFGIAVAEALACRVPVLISNQINISREILEDGAGVVCDDTLDGAAHLFQAWINLNPEQKEMMKRAARLSYEKRFDISVCARKLLAAIREVSFNPSR